MKWDPFIQNLKPASSSNPLLDVFSMQSKKFFFFNSRSSLVKMIRNTQMSEQKKSVFLSSVSDKMKLKRKNGESLSS